MPYMALEYVEGRNLREYITQKGPPELPSGAEHHAADRRGACSAPPNWASSTATSSRKTSS